MIKTAIIGCGDIAGGYDEVKQSDGVFTHAGAYREFPDIQIVAAFDTKKERLKSFCQYWKVEKPCATLEELLNGSYDIVSVCTPDMTHAEVMDAILKRNCTKYIWAEKPFTVSFDSAQQIIDKAKEKKVGLWLNNQRRWEPCHLKIKSLIEENAIGNIIHVNGYYVKGITHIGCTVVDTLRLLCGEVEWVMAYPPFEQGSYGQDKSLRGVLGFGNGITANIVGCDRDAYTYSIFEIDIIGTEGRIKIEDSGDMIRIYKLKEYSHYPGFKELVFCEERVTELKWAVKYCLGTLRDDVLEDRRSTFFAQEGLKDLRVIEWLKESAANGGIKCAVKESAEDKNGIIV